MNSSIRFRPMHFGFIFATIAIALTSVALADLATLIPASDLINCEELVKILQSAKSEKPLMIQVGSSMSSTRRRTFPARNTSVRAPVKAACSRCESASNLCQGKNSSCFIAGVVLGATARTSSLPTMSYAPWASPE